MGKLAILILTKGKVELIEVSLQFTFKQDKAHSNSPILLMDICTWIES